MATTRPGNCCKLAVEARNQAAGGGQKKSSGPGRETSLNPARDYGVEERVFSETSIFPSGSWIPGKVENVEMKQDSDQWASLSSAMI
ncbi:MAG: hypothetical protein ABIF77_10750 [bacterium]